MISIKLTYPNGVSIKNPEQATFAELLSKPEDFFTPDSCGEAAVDFANDDIETGLGIRIVCGTDFSIEWMMAKGPEEVGSASIVLAVPLDGETVIAHVGGMPLHLPRASVVSKEQALDIITEFCARGRIGHPWNVARLGALPRHAYYWGDHPE